MKLLAIFFQSITVSINSGVFFVSTQWRQKKFHLSIFVTTDLIKFELKIAAILGGRSTLQNPQNVLLDRIKVIC